MNNHEKSIYSRTLFFLQSASKLAIKKLMIRYGGSLNRQITFWALFLKKQAPDALMHQVVPEELTSTWNLTHVHSLSHKFFHHLEDKCLLFWLSNVSRKLIDLPFLNRIWKNSVFRGFVINHAKKFSTRNLSFFSSTISSGKVFYYFAWSYLISGY